MRKLALYRAIKTKIDRSIQDPKILLRCLRCRDLLGRCGSRVVSFQVLNQAVQRLSKADIG